MRSCLLGVFLLWLLTVVHAAHFLSNTQQWTLLTRAPSEETLRFTLALKAPNAQGLKQVFHERSNPTHARYRQWLSDSEVLVYTTPTSENQTRLMAWLTGNGVPPQAIRNTGDAVFVEATVATARQLFQTDFYRARHRLNQRLAVIQVGQWALPDDLARDVVELVLGIGTCAPPTGEGGPPPRRRTEDALSIVPATLFDLYSFPTAHPNVYEKRTRQAVVQFQDQFFSSDDLVAFGRGVGLDLKPIAPDHIVGQNDPTNPQMEGTLDSQMIAAMYNNTNGGSTWFWIEPSDAWLFDFTQHLFGREAATRPQVVSVSYGWSATEQEMVEPMVTGQSLRYVARIDQELMKLGATGISVIVAAGDAGTHSRVDPECTASHFHADYPGSSPWVTSVGASQLLFSEPLRSNNIPPVCLGLPLPCANGSVGYETAVSFDPARFATGGGFNNFSAIPDYQAEAVAHYLQSGTALPPQHYWNRTSRAWPDLSAIGHQCVVIQKGVPRTVGGSSCSAPIFAGIVSRLNDVSLHKTNRTLGFLNPLLYQMAHCFKDIVSGDNFCSEKHCRRSCRGFYAAPGYDPVSGLGTPNVTCMLDFVARLS